MNDTIFTIILIITWIIGLFGSFVMGYIITKHDQKTNPSHRYTNSDVIDTQYSIGGPLVILPLFNFVWLIYVICVYMCSIYNIKFDFFNKEI